jgi:hypothetical protein
MHALGHSEARKRDTISGGQTMDRKLARKNIRSGLIAGAVCVFMLGITFIAAAIYVHS